MTLNDVKVGDEVIHQSGYGMCGSRTRMEVTKVTATLIVCGRSRFRKDNGDSYPYQRGFNHSKILVPTKELQEQVEREELISFVKYNLPELASRLSLDSLKAIKVAATSHQLMEEE